MSEHVLNAEGLNCPLPILKTKKALKSIPQGEILTVSATDPGSIADMAAFCNQTGNELVNSSNDGSIYKFEIRRA